MSTATPDTSPPPPQAKPRRTPEEQYRWQSADAQGANQQLEILDKVRTSNMIHRGQKQLHQLTELRNRKLYGKDEVEAVAIPDDDIRINCPEIHNHYDDRPASTSSTSVTKEVSSVAASAAPGLSTLAKIAIAGAVGGPIGAGIMAAPVIAKWLSPPAAVAPAVPGQPTINIGGTEYQLNLGKEDQ